MLKTFFPQSTFMTRTKGNLNERHPVPSLHKHLGPAIRQLVVLYVLVWKCASQGGNEFTANLCNNTSRTESQAVCVSNQSEQLSLTCRIPAPTIAWKSPAEVPLLTDNVPHHPSDDGMCTVGSVRVKQEMVHLLSGKWVSCSDPTNVNLKGTFSFIMLDSDSWIEIKKVSLYTNRVSGYIDLILKDNYTKCGYVGYVVSAGGCDESNEGVISVQTGQNLVIRVMFGDFSSLSNFSVTAHSNIRDSFCKQFTLRHTFITSSTHKSSATVYSTVLSYDKGISFTGVKHPANGGHCVVKNITDMTAELTCSGLPPHEYSSKATLTGVVLTDGGKSYPIEVIVPFSGGSMYAEADLRNGDSTQSSASSSEPPHDHIPLPTYLTIFMLAGSIVVILLILILCGVTGIICIKCYYRIHRVSRDRERFAHYHMIHSTQNNRPSTVTRGPSCENTSSV